jgi:hypothetical protein
MFGCLMHGVQGISRVKKICQHLPLLLTPAVSEFSTVIPGPIIILESNLTGMEKSSLFFGRIPQSGYYGNSCIHVF